MTGSWSAAELPHRVSQMYVEDTLRSEAAAQPSVSIRYGWRMTPTDLSTHALTCAQGKDCSRLVRANALDLPFMADSFDALLSLDMMVHLSPGEERVAMREFARVMRPEGLLFLRAAAFDALRSRHSAFVGERQRFRLTQLRNLAESNGFQVLRSTYANTLLLPLAWTKFRLWEPLTSAPVDSGVTMGPRWLEAAFHSALALEARWIGAGLNLPIGQTVILVAEKQ